MTSFKTADLCDDFATELQIAAPGFSDFGGNRTFCGRISTVKCFEDNSKVRQQLSTSGEGRVLVVDAGASTRCAMLGDMLAQLGVDNGWSGILMYGLIRDSHDISQMPIGVKALGTFPRKSEKKDIGEIDVAVEFHGVTFCPGDFLYADHDGIIVSPTELNP